VTDFIGLPQGCEATAIIVENCSRQLRAYGQAIVRPDLDESLQLPATRNACKLAVKMLRGLLESMPAEPKKTTQRKPSR